MYFLFQRIVDGIPGIGRIKLILSVILSAGNGILVRWLARTIVLPFYHDHEQDFRVWIHWGVSAYHHLFL
jgi:hypothetical protein